LLSRGTVRTLALLNLGGGTLARGAACEADVRTALRAAGIPAEVRLTPAERLAAAARDAVASGVELVVAGGGDGTVGAVAGALAGSDTALGVLPLGTFNHFARDLGVPAGVEAAARALATATRRRIDMAEVNGHRFLNNSALGFYPEVVRERAEPHPRTRWRKLAVSLAAAARIAGRYRLSRVTLEVDGQRIQRRTPLLLVSNNPAEMRLLRFGSRSRLDTGRLMVYVHHGASYLALLHTLLVGLLRDVRAAGRFEQWLTPEVQIDLRRHRAVPVFLDGELLHLQPPLRYRLLPGRLLVAAPAQGNAEAPLSPQAA
jgi:diacylglycerol kinase family enzyme